MPRKGAEAIEKHLRWTRDYLRRKAHGEDWRGIIAHFGFMCAKCCSQEDLELHEPFGELRVAVRIGENHKMQARVLLCIDCHMAEHPGRFVRDRGNPSSYLEDIAREIDECGSYEAWVEKYEVGKLVGKAEEAIEKGEKQAVESVGI